ncbi:sulfhydryl oxidase 1 [Malaclemys terrapin pileata]|uniref:sulfhydryl oxidase 1 n=1 Tax=Malaclemys terrapin pileata TaxID=2991368 RepID=UPI0023A8B3E5|nr:sulfhydryl oxidase 1 [Malaclemys terrapin pileata]
MARRRCHPHAALLLLLAATLAGAPPGGLYSPGDPLVLLQVDTLESSVLNSSSAWLVEFYASWCGHCVHFAPTWRALAADIQEWSPAVNVGVVDCADIANQKTCGKFGITGFPTLKFFKAFSKSPEDGTKIFHPGDSIQNLRQSIITNLEMHKESWPPACPPLEPASVEEIRGFFQTNNVTYLVLIFETNDSFLGREVTLDMLQYENIAVRRVLSSEEELVKKYGVTAFPSSFLLINNGTFSRIPVQVEARSFYTHFLRRLPGVTRGPYTPTRAPDTPIKTTPTPRRPADSSKVYMADLESALHYALRVEVARFSVLTGERVRALKDFVAVLAKYFPGRPFVQNFLRSVDRWLRNVRESRIPYSALELVLTNRKEGQAPAVLSNNVTWVGCQGSEPHFRGYPCSLWILFHLLTVQATRHPRLGTGPLEVLGAMRGYVQSFFGCRECAQHFEGMAAESMDKVRSVDEAALWLWSRHNRVNARLAGTETEDPQFPKLQWPPPELCRPCHSVVKRRQVWDEAAVLQFLKAYFSPINIFLNYTEPETALVVRRSQEAKEGAGEWAMGEGEERGEEDDDKEEERGENGRGEGEERRPGKLEGAGLGMEVGGSERRGFSGPRKPSIIRMNPKMQELEEDIVDLDSFSELHYKSKALKAAANKGRRLSKRDTIPLLLADDSHQAFDYAAVWERLRRQGLGSKQLIGALEEDEGDTLRRSHWFRMLGVGFSRLDVSLCIILYFLSSMCLLGMYTFFRMRTRHRKGRPSFPTA